MKETETNNNTKEINDEKIKNAAKAKKDRFRYGNYNQYYGTRIKGFERDPRLDLLPADWFKNRSILDIGCNVGYLTLSIAKEYEPFRILGIDIDTNLIGIARKNIRHYCNENEKLIGKFPISIASTSCSDLTNGNFKQYKFPNNVWFQYDNYVLEDDYLLEMVKPEFDVILALSITKWVHLNWGDDGIKRFLKRIYLHLKPGGRLILEMQDFSSYAKRSKLADDMRENYKKISFPPEQFPDFLLSSAVGFSKMQELGIPKAKSKGFERSIIVFYKDFTTKKRKNQINALCENLKKEKISNGDENDNVPEILQK